MLALISFLMILVVSMFFTKLGSAALVQTGISSQMARFQARSAFTGCGYTTSESDQIVNHPVRRRIISTLMLIGNAGVVTAISTLILTFLQQDPAFSINLTQRLLILFGGVVLLWFVASSALIDKAISLLVVWLFKRFTKLEVRDYANLLHLAEHFAVSELGVKKGDWICGKTIGTSHLEREGLLILGIERSDGTYIGIPKSKTAICPGDTIYLYGTEEAVMSLDSREEGVAARQSRFESIQRERERLKKQQVADEQSETGATNVSVK